MNLLLLESRLRIDESLLRRYRLALGINRLGRRERSNPHLLLYVGKKRSAVSAALRFALMSCEAAWSE